MNNKEYCEIMDNSNFMIDSQNPYDMKIKEALEKQLAKKPLNIFECDDFHFDWTCPCCKRQFVGSTYGIKHCVDCGQLLDWE